MPGSRGCCAVLLLQGVTAAAVSPHHETNLFFLLSEDVPGLSYFYFFLLPETA